MRSNDESVAMLEKVLRAGESRPRCDWRGEVASLGCWTARTDAMSSIWHMTSGTAAKPTISTGEPTSLELERVEACEPRRSSSLMDTASNPTLSRARNMSGLLSLEASFTGALDVSAEAGSSILAR